MKKLLLWVLVALVPLGLHARELLTARQDGLPAEEEQIRLAERGILQAVILEDKTSVLVLPETLFDPPFNQIILTPAAQAAVRRAEEMTYAYFVRGWMAWRAAANAYLPAGYQLPALSFTLAEDTQARLPSGAFAVHLVSRFPSQPVHYSGRYTYSPSSVDRIELVLPLHLLKYWAFSGQDPLQRAFAEGDLRNAACNIAAGPFNYWDSLVLKGNSLDDVDWIHHYRPLEKEEEACLKTLMTLPVGEWLYRGPFAAHNQRVMTHEWGHFLGFEHIDNSVMTISEAAAKKQITPEKQDGLLLAEKVCRYHNKKAGKTVCRPETAPSAVKPAPAK